MIERPNPLSVMPLVAPYGDSIKDAVDDVYERVKQAGTARSEWMSKQEKLLRQRKGVRKPKAFPWPGANNNSWPLTDSILRRWKPGIVSLIVDSDPVAYFFPQNPEATAAAPVAQSYYHWRFHSMESVQETALELSDYVGQYGTAYTRQGWEYTTRLKCRLVNVATLFPNGVQAAVDQFNMQVDQMTMQIQQAAAQGQDVSQAMQQIPPKTTPLDLVTDTLEKEYLIDSNQPLEKAQLDEAVQMILQGAQQVRFYFRTIIHDRPSWKALCATDVIVPARCQKIEDAEFIAIRHTVCADDILKMAQDGYFWPAPAQEVAKSVQERSKGEAENDTVFGPMDSQRSLNDVRDRADGITSADVEDEYSTVLLELLCKIDINRDGLREKVIVWYHPDSKTILALTPSPYPFEEWPIVRFQLEHNSTRPYESRGITELVSTFQAQANKLHNARLDAIQVTLVPMFQMRTTVADAKRNITFKPGTIIPVQNVGDIAPLPVDTKSIIQLMQEENLTKNLAEQYVGVFDPSVMAQNASERRTATEVEAVMNQVQAVFGQDAKLFQAAMKKVHKQLWDLIEDFDRPEVFYRVEGEEMPRLAKKHEISFDYDIVPAGTPANTSKQLAMARAREAMQLFWADQTGLIDKRALAVNYFNATDRNLGKIIVRSPEQAAMFQQMAQIVNERQAAAGAPPIETP